MVSVLLTGMSGSGKSTALAGLATRGYETVDTDDPGWMEFVDGAPRWRHARITVLLDERRDGALFVGGTVRSQGRFTDGFDAVVLLTAPTEVLLERVRARAGHRSGATDSDRGSTADDDRETELLLRSGATHVVDSQAPLETVLLRLIEISAA